MCNIKYKKIPQTLMCETVSAPAEKLVTQLVRCRKMRPVRTLCVKIQNLYISVSNCKSMQMLVSRGRELTDP